MKWIVKVQVIDGQAKLRQSEKIKLHDTVSQKFSIVDLNNFSPSVDIYNYVDSRLNSDVSFTDDFNEIEQDGSTNNRRKRSYEETGLDKDSLLRNTELEMEFENVREPSDYSKSSKNEKTLNRLTKFSLEYHNNSNIYDKNNLTLDNRNKTNFSKNLEEFKLRPIVVNSSLDLEAKNILSHSKIKTQRKGFVDNDKKKIRHCRNTKNSNSDSNHDKLKKNKISVRENTSPSKNFDKESNWSRVFPTSGDNRSLLSEHENNKNNLNGYFRIDRFPIKEDDLLRIRSRFFKKYYKVRRDLLPKIHRDPSQIYKSYYNSSTKLIRFPSLFKPNTGGENINIFNKRHIVSVKEKLNSRFSYSKLNETENSYRIVPNRSIKNTKPKLGTRLKTQKKTNIKKDKHFTRHGKSIIETKTSRSSERISEVKTSKKVSEVQPRNLISRGARDIKTENKENNRRSTSKNYIFSGTWGCSDFDVYSDILQNKEKDSMLKLSSNDDDIDSKSSSKEVNVAETTVTIIVKDINDNAPVFPNETMFGEVQENGPIGKFRNNIHCNFFHI